MKLQKIKEGLFASEDSKNILNKIDAIIFDCDGVLIDIANSYDLTIQRTASYILKEVANITKFNPVTSQIIDGFKATGGFNDEVDLTYAAILSLVTAHKLKKPGHKFIFEVIEHADQTGIESVENYLDSLGVDLSDIKAKLQYPGRHLDSPLYSIFDQLFYGPKLFYKLFGANSKFSDNGLIENDVVLLNQETMDELKKKFDNKIAIVSGRGIESIRYSLKELLDEFDLKNSVFLEDEPREMAKPNPDSLIKAIKGMNSQHCLYVGDSMEDFLMAKKATEKGYPTFFCGIFGTSKFPEKKLELFEKNGAGMVLKSIDLIPKALNLV